ncbi:MAG: hypothetical protein M1314_03045 [Firmicutes bacterium]|nr:hypothetical protein [Bacillota bacterium]
MRNAVKAATRYYGIRLQDLGGNGWMIAAMRTKAPMSVETAQRLMEIIREPRPGLVGRKRPQGTSVAEVLKSAIAANELEKSGGPSAMESAAALKDNAGAQYIADTLMASLTLQRYVIPTPGTAVFVMPGASRSVAENLTHLLPLGNVGKQRSRAITETLERYFKLGEEPLQTNLGKRLIPRLTVLSLIRNLNVATERHKREGWTDEEAAALEGLVRDVVKSENRRDRAK